MLSDSTNVTALLRRWREGDQGAEAELFEIVLPELHKIARRCLARERSDHTLQATELIGEVYGRLVKAKDRDWADRTHFFAIVARTMRRYLIDYARARRKGMEVPLDDIVQMLPVTSDLETVTLIDGQLDILAAQRPDWCSVVEMKYYLGLTDEETAVAMNLPLRTAQRHWHDARRWLFERLNGVAKV